MPRKIIDLTGKVLGRYTVLRFVGGERAKWLVRCECGREKEVTGASLRSGEAAGCLTCANARKTGIPLTHGFAQSRGGRRIGTRWSTYHAYYNMQRRCGEPANRSYKNYGGRGITVCARWLESFENFLADMGEKPAGTSIDRIDVNGNYEPGNCRWATAKEQAANKRRPLKKAA